MALALVASKARVQVLWRAKINLGLLKVFSRQCPLALTLPRGGALGSKQDGARVLLLVPPLSVFIQMRMMMGW